MVSGPEHLGVGLDALAMTEIHLCDSPHWSIRVLPVVACARALTVCGIAVAIAAVVALRSIAQNYEQSQRDALHSVGRRTW